MTKMPCSRCGRALRTEASITAGIGPTCAKRIRQEAVAADVKAETLAKAIEDLEDGAVQPTTRTTSSGRRVFVVIGSDGGSRYLATSTACTCRGGHRGRLCRHRVAVRLRVA